MGDVLDGIVASGLSLPIVILIFFMLVFLGKLIPRRTFEDFKSSMESRLKEAQDDASEWKAAFLASEAVRTEQGAALPVILEMGKTQEHLLRSIHERADEKK